MHWIKVDNHRLFVTIQVIRKLLDLISMKYLFKQTIIMLWCFACCSGQDRKKSMHGIAQMLLHTVDVVAEDQLGLGATLEPK